MQNLFEWSGHSSWGIRSTELTHYIETCKGCLNNQDIPPEKSEALDSHSILEHAKIAWVVRTFLLRNQEHWTHPLCWNMQRLLEWSGYSFWKIRSTGLTSYVRICKSCLSNQYIPPENSEALDSPAMLEQYKVCLSDQNIPLRNQRHWTHPLCWNNAKVVWVISTFFLRNQRHWTHILCWNNTKVV